MFYVTQLCSCDVSSVLCGMSSVLCDVSSVLCDVSSVLCDVSSVLCMCKEPKRRATVQSYLVQ